MGQFFRILNDASTGPYNDWIETIQNDGLIVYRSYLNVYRVMPTSSSVLAELLTRRAYDFAKPQTVTRNLAYFLGKGLVIAEGEEHKVSHLMRMQFAENNG